ncbi:MAG: ABC transporter permease [Rhodospirillaceae bacterium]|nr:ABC transporter permease [Rhodospirillaceae bacterium]|tara:strand:+ start:26353 stop:27141 length:789 start_codon:yes stop_codon:yes gene_type:complete
MTIKTIAARNSMWASLGLLVLFLVGWEWGPGLLNIPPYIIPTASSVYQEFIHAVEREQLFFHTWITALETFVGFAIGALLGMVIGYVLGISARAEFILSPYILALQIAPKVAFAPLFVLWFGYTVYPKILVAVLIVFFPIMVNVLGAIRTVDPDLINLARTFSATRWQIFRLIEFHDALPPLFSGLRIASTLAVIGVVVGEMVGGNLGLGFLLVFGEGAGNTALVFVTIIMLTIVGIIAYGGVVLLEKKVLHYLPKKEYAPV